jgi:hypothetical protein
LETYADSAEWSILKASDVAINASFIAHICVIITSLSLSPRVYCVLSKILNFIALHAGSSCFIAA